MKLTVALPLPPDGAANEIQLTSGDAFHEQSLAVAIATEALPPSEPMFWDDGVTSNRHGARCETRTLLSLMTMSASRAAALSFGATRNERVPLP